MTKSQMQSLIQTKEDNEFPVFFICLTITFLIFVLSPVCWGQAWVQDGFYSYPLHKGFPVQVSGRLTKSIVIADVDHDGQSEICFSVGGKTYLLRHNGQSYSTVWPKDGGSLTPALFDADNDDRDEIIRASLNFSIWDLDGSELPGWPYQFPDGVYPYDTVSILDFDGDGTSEITLAYGSAESGYFLSLLNPNGSSRPGFPIEVADNISYAPGLADLDSDGISEVLVGHWGWDEERVVAYDIYGNLFQEIGLSISEKWILVVLAVILPSQMSMGTSDRRSCSVQMSHLVERISTQ